MARQRERREKKCKKPNTFHVWVISLNAEYEVCQHCGAVRKKGESYY